MVERERVSTVASSLLFLILLQLPSFTHGFQPLFSYRTDTSTHRTITEKAILQKTAEVCRDMATAAGKNFNLSITDDLSAAQVISACSSSSSLNNTSPILNDVIFQTSISTVYFSNAAVDLINALSGRHHFDDETFEMARDLITADVSALRESVKFELFYLARLTLGRICHTLQDFYSHSNWVELGNKAPYSVLIQPDQSLENLADANTPTCRNCTDGNCENNTMPNLVQEQLLTSGYFDLFSSAKPPGKCSHGGSFDRTSGADPVGGISKDDTGSTHGFLHQNAAALAVKATEELLEDIRLSVGDEGFLRLMGVTIAPVLCLVVDTTGTMGIDIAEVKRLSSEIIDSMRGTQQEPSTYILVPFNDPGVGPLAITTDADIFKEMLNMLSASGGGDVPEMCLSGLQLALTVVPPSSEIFVFTDAPAKDSNLGSTITALIESTKSVVTFLLTGTSNLQQYRDLAASSGGLAVEVSKSAIAAATSIIRDSTVGPVVTIFQVTLDPGQSENFTFAVDSSLRNMTVYITGFSSLTFTLTNPAGVTQSSSQTSGPLASITTVGNLHRLKVITSYTIGTWSINIVSTDPYTVKVTGQSEVDIIVNIVEAFQGAHGDFSLKEGLPLTGGTVNAFLTVTGHDPVSVTKVALIDRAGHTRVIGSVQSMGASNYLVTFTNVPAGDFAVQLEGEESPACITPAGTRNVQRQMPTRFRTSSVSFTAQATGTSFEPNTNVTIPFTIAITSNGEVNASAVGNFIVRATNDRNYQSTTTITGTAARSNGVVNGLVTLMVPSYAVLGLGVTLTIGADNTDNSEHNYAVLKFSVAEKLTDVTDPVCQEVRTVSNCSTSSSFCSSGHWEFVANLTDGFNGTGLDRVYMRYGNGTFHTSSVASDGQDVTVVTYNASCCSPIVQLVAVDRVGNSGTCMGRAIAPLVSTESPTTTSTEAMTTSAAPTRALTTEAMTTSAAHTMCMLGSLWISTVLFLLGQ